MQTPHTSVTNKERIEFKKKPDYRSHEGCNGEIDYEYLKGLKTGLILKQLQEIPHASSLLMQKKNVCGKDNRKTPDIKKSPFFMICNLIIKTGNRGTFRASGFFISPKCIITAGHCVYQNRAWAESIEVIPGDESRTRPFGSATSTDFFAVEGWVNDENHEYDYGAVILENEDLFKVINSYFGYTPYTPSADDLHNSGYPHDHDSIQKHSFGKVLPEVNKSLIKYNIDTYSGNSGSPVFLNKNGQFIAVGVHTYGQCPNHAVKVTDEVISNWNNWSRNH